MIATHYYVSNYALVFITYSESPTFQTIKQTDTWVMQNVYLYVDRIVSHTLWVWKCKWTNFLILYRIIYIMKVTITWIIEYFLYFAWEFMIFHLLFTTQKKLQTRLVNWKYCHESECINADILTFRIILLNNFRITLASKYSLTSNFCMHTRTHTHIDDTNTSLKQGLDNDSNFIWYTHIRTQNATHKYKAQTHTD